MISFSEDLQVYIHREEVDMRKSIHGLLYLVVESMGLDPQSKALYLFHNRRCDKIKAVIWDGDGFMLLYKCLQKKRFVFPKEMMGNHYEIDGDLLTWLLKGFDFYSLKQHPELKVSSYY